MTTHLEFIEDERGDVVDIHYWHGWCAPIYVRAAGAWPCPDWPDYAVYCEGCRELMHDA